jgi:hypothetical protein
MFPLEKSNEICVGREVNQAPLDATPQQFVIPI